MRDFRNIKAWEKAHELVQIVYRETGSMPADERFGLTSQIRRAAVSVPTNIAEGCGRDSERDFSRFLHIAMGSASEVEYLCLLLRDLGFINDQDYDALYEKVAEVKRMLTGFLKKLKAEG